MEQLKNMKEQLTSIVQGQLVHTDCVNTKELGEAVDMIKDLAEAIYYCSITDAMEKTDKEKQDGNIYYYTMPTMPMMPYEDYNRGRMYYGGNQGGGNSGQGSGGNNSSSRSYGGGQSSGYYTPSRMNPVYYTPDMHREYEYMPEQMMPHDPREGRARQSRRMYMESKEMHKDSATQMRELEKYIQDLGEDITEMITNATPEEKQVLQQKIATLSTKIR